VLEKFREIAGALEEDEEDGQWLKRCRELEKEVRKKIPEFMVVVAFGHQTQRAPQIQEGLSCSQANKTKNALLTESAQRLLWLYQRCLPAVVAEARFDVGKVLHTFATAAEDDEKEEGSDAVERLYRVQQLHILRLLRVSNQFAWSVKICKFRIVVFRRRLMFFQPHCHTLHSTCYSKFLHPLKFLQSGRLSATLSVTFYRTVFCFKKTPKNRIFG
jgi:nucleolar pre-ribosomal-associated protein 1